MLQAFLAGQLFGEPAGPTPVQVVFLHGWGRSSSDFRVAAAALADEGVGTLALDLPGFGASPVPTVAGGARHYADVLIPALREISGGRPVVLVGHSFGGRIAVVLAARCPDLVGAVVATGAPLLARESGHRRSPVAYRVIRRAAAWGVFSEARLERARQKYGSADYRAASGVLREILVATVQETYGDELRALRQPLALVWGAEDRDVPVQVAERVVAETGATLRVEPGVGHLLPLERPTALVQVIREVLP